MCSHVPTYSQRQINYCYTCGFIYAERGITVPRNSLTRYTARHLRIKRLVQFILVGAVYHNALTNCAALLSPRGPSLALRAIHLVPRLRRVARMCSSTLSDTANRLRKIRKKKSSAVPLFRSGHMSAICARLSKGKGRFTRGWKPRGFALFLQFLRYI